MELLKGGGVDIDRSMRKPPKVEPVVKIPGMRARSVRRLVQVLRQHVLEELRKLAARAGIAFDSVDYVWQDDTGGSCTHPQQRGLERVARSWTSSIVQLGGGLEQFGKRQYWYLDGAGADTHYPVRALAKCFALS
ncbi:hypothetical protein ACFWAY_17575 [Rhodococcus sp. NPDC059968]|uniref:hypothetical protein n=1 Tax=Rhodococcus sp. NPDC059968 TaxID=3347017 RepID=UPI003671EAEC